MRKNLVLALALLIIISLIGLILIRTFTYPFTSKKKGTAQILQNLAVSDSSISRLSGGIKIPTISSSDLAEFNYGPFNEFIAYMKKEYSYIYQNTESTIINGHALVFRLRGTDSNLPPILFLSHYDVVGPGSAPIKHMDQHIFRPQDTAKAPMDKIAEQWDYSPFSGAVAHGRIYGRGTMDMKGMLFALMEALQNTIKKGERPSRDIYLAFGFDEEIGGEMGAAKIVTFFKEKGIRFDAVYDEGGFILEKGSVPGIDANVALIGCAEKGYLSLKVKVKGLGGHSSMPPSESAIGKAAVIMQRLERLPMQPKITPLISDFFKNVGGAMSFPSRLAIANRWLLEPILISTLSKNHATNALIRSTTALTMMRGSEAANVLSSEVEFVANFRLLPGDTIEQVKAHVEKASEGFDVEISEVDNAREASIVSPSKAKAYKIMESSLNSIYSNVLITPYLTVGGTDAIKYQNLSSNIYRFMPIKINDSEQQSMHSINEYISIENYGKMIQYFAFIMQNYDK